MQKGKFGRYSSHRTLSILKKNRDGKEGGWGGGEGLKWYANLQNRANFWPDLSMYMHFRSNLSLSYFVFAADVWASSVQTVQHFTN